MTTMRNGSPAHSPYYVHDVITYVCNDVNDTIIGASETLCYEDLEARRMRWTNEGKPSVCERE